MKEECQNCFTDVIPMEDGRCPACGQIAVSSLRGMLTKVTVFQGQNPGVVCMKCGTITDGALTIRKKARNSDYKPNSSSSLESHPFALLMNFFAGKYHKTVEVKVPLCANCRQREVIEPRYVDFERHSMTFVAHRAWKEEIVGSRGAGRGT
jgi:hypothetical protein